MKINNPLLPKFPITIKSKDERIEMEQRLNKLGYNPTQWTPIQLKNLHENSFPLKLKSLNHDLKIYRYGY